VTREDWRPLDWDMCPECGGNDLEARTRCADGQVQDGDAVRCVTCRATGGAVVEEDGRAWIDWDDGIAEHGVTL
jgi:hypothetical protein